MNRRTFIETAAVVALALGLPASWPAEAGAEIRVLSRPAILAMLGEARVRAIGLRYRESFPGDAEALQSAILTNREAGLAITEQLRRHIQRDFESGRTILVDGWVLSATEARQCALFSLLHP